MPSSSYRFPVATTLLLFLALALPLRASAPEATAAEIFAHAKAEAGVDHKHILMVFSASWCGPCKLYERFLEDPEMKRITSQAFVVERVDVGERTGDKNHADTPGGEKLRSALGADPQPGFPFLIMTEADGNPIVNSYLSGDRKNNIGYPALPAEVDWYMAMMKQAAPDISANDLNAMRTWLKVHAPR
jgi:thiol-disulfide isomerase/thioredoxin